MIMTPALDADLITSSDLFPAGLGLADTALDHGANTNGVFGQTTACPVASDYDDDDDEDYFYDDDEDDDDDLDDEFDDEDDDGRSEDDDEDDDL